MLKALKSPAGKSCGSVVPKLKQVALLRHSTKLFLCPPQKREGTLAVIQPQPLSPVLVVCLLNFTRHCGSAEHKVHKADPNTLHPSDHSALALCSSTRLSFGDIGRPECLEPVP